MRFWPLIWSSLRRKRVRTLLTLLCILIAFLLYGYLAAINTAFRMGVDLTGVDRLVLRHKVSIIQMLPESYLERIEQVPGVVDVAHASWFGGIYQDPIKFFPQMAVDPERYLRLYPEFILPKEQKKAWFANRTGAIAGRTIAEKYGWKVGDRIPIQGTVWRPADGSTWEFTLEGIYNGAEEGTDTSNFFFHYKYLDESRPYAKGMVGWYVIRINDPLQAAAIAERIDAQFANSFYETETSTERAFVQAFAKQVGNVGAIIAAVLTAVFFTILVVSGNTLMQSFRERITELAVLKTLGYSNGLVLRLVLAESLLLAGAGAALGLSLAWVLIRRGDPTGGAMPRFYFPQQDLVLGVVLAVVLGLLVGMPPAVQALRLRVVDALRRT
jgi:putative ABC transport system permease protein